MKPLIVMLSALAILVTGCASDPNFEATRVSSHASEIDEAWVQLFEGKDFTGRKLTIRYPRDIANLEDVRSDNGEPGFEDKPSSAKWVIPEGWSFVLYEDPIFEGEQTELKGSGAVQEIADFDKFNQRENQASSGRWMKNQD